MRHHLFPLAQLAVVVAITVALFAWALRRGPPPDGPLPDPWATDAAAVRITPPLPGYHPDMREPFYIDTRTGRPVPADRGNFR